MRAAEEQLRHGLKILYDTLDFYELCLISFTDTSCRVSRIMHSHTLCGDPFCECRMTCLPNVIDIIDCFDTDSSFVCRIVSQQIDINANYANSCSSLLDIIVIIL